MRSWKKSFLFVALVLASFLTYSSRVLAHEDQRDGNITVELHIDPDDDPIIGQAATLHVVLQDATGKFQLVHCECLVSIAEGARTFSALPLHAPFKMPSVYSAEAMFTFPQQGLFGITVAGKAKDGSFQNFHVAFSQDVARNPSDPPKPGHALWRHAEHYALIAVFVILFIILGVQGKLTFQQKHKEGSRSAEG